LAERDHGADHQHAPGALVEMRPGQISPQAWRVIRSMNSALNELLLAIDLSTQASPSTLRPLGHAVRRGVVDRPFENSSSRHCEERSDEAIHSSFDYGLLPLRSQ